MTKKLSKILSLFLVLAFFLTTGFGCALTSNEVKEKLEPITLTYWRVWDDKDAFDEIIAAYQALHPNITIEYRKFRYDEYEQELLDALAEDRGPDIFSIHESWLRKYQSKISPMPAKITMVYQHTEGSLKKEVVSELKTTATPTLREIKQNFADAVYQDAVIDERVYGLPLGLESLVLFYNRDILNAAGIAEIPTNWEDFQTAVQKTTRFDSKENIVQAGAALGTGSNIERSFDIASILMMQNGATMMSGGQTAFGKGSNQVYPGIQALQFFTDFSSPTKTVYTWNKDMNPSLDSFLSGQLAFFFGYNYHIPTIKSRAPRLNFGIAPIPQINAGSPVNYASYWLETVSQKSPHTNEAWDFITFATAKEQAASYLTKTSKPAALRALISTQANDENIYAASTQTLTATSWYDGKDPLAAETAFKEMLDQLSDSIDEKEFKSIINTAIQKINQTIK